MGDSLKTKDSFSKDHRETHGQYQLVKNKKTWPSSEDAITWVSPWGRKQDFKVRKGKEDKIFCFCQSINQTGDFYCTKVQLGSSQIPQ